MYKAHPNNGKSRERRNLPFVKVLMYHRIVSDKSLPGSHWTCVSAKEFRSQLEALEKWGFTTVTFDDCRLFLKGELNLPRKPVVLTFDDGYRDTYRYALPALQEFGMKAVVFVLGERRIRTNAWDKCLGIHGAPLMKEVEIKELRGAGFEIGSHTMHHARLTEVSEHDAWKEISVSKIQLEDMLGASVPSFSYPYGAVNQMLKQLVKAAGYDIACSVVSGPAVFNKDVFEIRRTTILNTTNIAEFRLKLLTTYRYYEWARWKTKNNLLNLVAKRSNGNDKIHRDVEEVEGAMRSSNEKQ